MKRETSKHPKGEMSAEAKEAARLRAKVWYAEHGEKKTAQRRKAYREDPEKALAKNALWKEKNPERAEEIAKKAYEKRRDTLITTAPVIHDADRFERIEAAMAAYKERKGEQQ